MEKKEKKERALVLMLIPLFFGLIFLIALLRENKEIERTSTSTSTTINPIENTKGIYRYEEDSKKLIGIKKMDNFSNFSVIQYENGKISIKQKNY